MQQTGQASRAKGAAMPCCLRAVQAETGRIKCARQGKGWRGIKLAWPRSLPGDMAARPS